VAVAERLSGGTSLRRLLEDATLSRESLLAILAAVMQRRSVIKEKP